MYCLDKTQEADFLKFIKTPSQNSNVCLNFKYVYDFEIFIRSVMKWVADNFKNDDIIIKHNYRKIYINTCEITINTKIVNRTGAIIAKKSTKNLICNSNNEFWTQCGFTVCNYQMIQNSSSIIKYGSIGQNIYNQFFFNNYGLHHELVADILEDAVAPRHYVEEKGLWINMDDFHNLYDNPGKINIYGDIKLCNQDDINFLVFKALVALVNDTEYDLFAYEQITCITDGHFRVCDPYDYDDDDNNHILTACDYIVHDNNITVIYTKTENIGNIIIWKKYGPRLYKQLAM